MAIRLSVMELGRFMLGAHGCLKRSRFSSIIAPRHGDTLRESRLSPRKKQIEAREICQAQFRPPIPGMRQGNTGCVGSPGMVGNFAIS
jgi:hypothetical protein